MMHRKIYQRKFLIVRCIIKICVWSLVVIILLFFYTILMNIFYHFFPIFCKTFPSKYIYIVFRKTNFVNIFSLNITRVFCIIKNNFILNIYENYFCNIIYFEEFLCQLFLKFLKILKSNNIFTSNSLIINWIDDKFYNI